MAGQAETFPANAGHTDSWDKRQGSLNNSTICDISGNENWPRPDIEGNLSSFSLPKSSDAPPETKQTHDVMDANTKKKRHASTSQQGNHKPIGRKRRKTSDRNTTHPQFLMGGSITDPLNLNSLCNEEVSRLLNAATPISSPLPHVNKDPNPIIVPFDVTDPLQLNTMCSQTDDTANLTRTLMPKSVGKKRKKRLEKPNESHSADEATVINKPANLNLDSVKPNHHGSMSTIPDKIVSPVLPDSGQSHRKRKKQEPTAKIARALQLEISDSKSANDTTEKRTSHTDRVTPEKRKYKRQSSKETKPQPKFKDQNKKFQYGNYHRYYGYRNPDQEDDARIAFLKKDWFEGKTCLDIGCNSGHVTLYVAKTFSPQRITGIDIDSVLIGIARKNICRCLEVERDSKKHKFPASMEKMYGPIASSGYPPESSASRFPGNILFRCANYVPENESIMELQKPEYDTILCLSVTKWIHLNWGDAGLKKLFRRIFLALRPGGRFILEPQAWPSYTKKKKLTETIYKNYKQIQLKPDKFKDYLLSSRIGFSSCETIGTPLNKSKGFRRPILMFTKLTTSRSSITKPSIGSSELTPSRRQEEPSGKVSCTDPTTSAVHHHTPSRHSNSSVVDSGKEWEADMTFDQRPRVTLDHETQVSHDEGNVAKIVAKSEDVREELLSKIKMEDNKDDNFKDNSHTEELSYICKIEKCDSPPTKKLKTGSSDEAVKDNSNDSAAL